MRALIYQQMGENGLAEDNFAAPASWRRPTRPANNYGSFLCQLAA
jgi:type IV pilus assembly protein PilF